MNDPYGHNCLVYKNKSLPYTFCLLASLFNLNDFLSVFSLLYALQKKKIAAEMKLLAVLAAYIILTILLLVDVEVFLLDKPLREEAIQRYFWCEALGNLNNECSRELVESYDNLYLDSASHLAFMLIPIVGLIFVINCRELKEKLQMGLSRPLKVPTSKKSVSSASASTQV